MRSETEGMHLASWITDIKGGVGCGMAEDVVTLATLVVALTETAAELEEAEEEE